MSDPHEKVLLDADSQYYDKLYKDYLCRENEKLLHELALIEYLNDPSMFDKYFDAINFDDEDTNDNGMLEKAKADIFNKKFQTDLAAFLEDKEE